MRRTRQQQVRPLGNFRCTFWRNHGRGCCMPAAPAWSARCCWMPCAICSLRSTRPKMIDCAAKQFGRNNCWPCLRWRSRSALSHGRIAVRQSAKGRRQPGPALGRCVAAAKPVEPAPTAVCIAATRSAWAAAAAEVGGWIEQSFRTR